MSDSTKAPDEGTENTGGNAGNYTPPASQEDLDKIISDRLARERAKFADYDEVKAKAAAHDEYVASQKTESERLAEELNAEREKNAALARENLRASVAADTGIPAALLTGDDEEALRASAEALIAFRGEQAKTPKGPHVPSEGRSPANTNDPNAEALTVLGFG